MAPPTNAGKHWDCHEHRDELMVSGACTVYHPVQGQLCYGERRGTCWLYYPLRFKDTAAAYRWIEKGTIAEIQESLTNLQVCFTTENLIHYTPY